MRAEYHLSGGLLGQIADTERTNLTAAWLTRTGCPSQNIDLGGLCEQVFSLVLLQYEPLSSYSDGALAFVVILTEKQLRYRLV